MKVWLILAVLAVTQVWAKELPEAPNVEVEEKFEEAPYVEGQEKSHKIIPYKDIIPEKEDLTLVAEVRGSEVVEAVEEKIQNSGIFPEDHDFFRRVAFVETADGSDFSTYREGYHGGIWQVDEKMFIKIKESAKGILVGIQEKFGINWAEVKWEDLRRPLHSAIAARLLILLTHNEIPEEIEAQASFWDSVYHPGGDRQTFLLEVEELHFGFCRRSAGPIRKLPYDSGKWLNIFVDKKLRCSGRVTVWEFFAKKRGQVFLSVWRPVKIFFHTIGWKRVGKNLVHVRRRGPQRHYVSSADMIKVRRGDVLGISYPELDDDDGEPTERGIIPYQNDEDFPWGKMGSVSRDFSRIHNEQIYDDAINDKKIRKGVRDFKRLAALAAYVNKKTPCFPNPCQNGGACSVAGIGYVCTCPDGFVGEDCEYEEACSVSGGPLEKLAYDSGVWLNVFADFAFDCRGNIVEWRFYAKRRGTVFLTAWRPGGSGWFLLGKNEIRVRRRGQHSVFIDEGDQIEVHAGDVIGIHYPDGAADDPEDDRGIIPYCDTREGGSGCTLPIKDLSRIHNVNVQDSEIEANPFRTGIRDFVRAVALSAHLHNPCDA